MMKMRMRLVLELGLLMMFACPKTYAITTTHHDKPEESTIPVMAVKMADRVNLTANEREKRLLPYENFYTSPTEEEQYYRPPLKKIYPQYEDSNIQQDVIYQSSNKFTPFLESNAIPGPFVPIATNRQRVQYASRPKVPDYSIIYDKLSQIKLQNSQRPIYFESYRKPQVNFSPQRNRYNDIPAKTTIETFVPTNIDIPSEPERYSPSPQPAKDYNNGEEFIESFQGSAKPYNQQILVEVPQPTYQQPSYGTFLVRKPHPSQKGRPYVLVPIRHSEHRVNLQPQPTPKPILVVQRKPVYTKPVSAAKYEPVTFLPQYVTVSEAPVQVENSNGLSQILKQLQASNTLPQTLTPDNIDNSIKTLVRILEALKSRQKLSKPIVVEDEVLEENHKEGGGENVPGTVTQNFPGDAPDGGTPGKPGVDYPALSTIPQTSFNCKTQRYKGFFGDPDTNCQVWHYCDLNGGQASFLCPNGTIFSQVALTCDWWYNVKCSSTPQLYVLNERLYKYIIPLSPKFPEDYSGPLVDKYLALKFQEMEEKMKKEKEKKLKADSEEKESEELQEIDNDEIEEPHERPKKPMIKTQERETLETIEDDNNQE